MPIVKVKEGESFESVLRRFKRACEKAGILNEVRNRDRYEKPKTIRKKQKAAAVRRRLKKEYRENVLNNRSSARSSTRRTRTSSSKTQYVRREA